MLTSSAYKAVCLARKFSLNSTHDSSREPLPKFPLKTGSLLSDMHKTRSMFSALLFNRDSHNEDLMVSMSLSLLYVLSNSGQLSNPSSYRRISLLPIFGNLLQASINAGLFKHFTSLAFLTENHYGFHAVGQLLM